LHIENSINVRDDIVLMNTNRSRRFIKYLDGRKEASDLNLVNYAELITNINTNHAYESDPFSCENTASMVQYSGLSQPEMYSLYPWYMPTDYSNITPPPVVVPPERTRKFIDTKVDTIADLIKIVQDNEYDVNVDYNIDLKSLHAIKDNLVQINSMIGMSKIKEDLLNQLLYFLQDLHLGNSGGDFKHTIIYGPPGTGKTEIAKMIGEMYSKVGILKKNVFRKVTRNDLVAGYLGQTAIKTKKVIEECLGGVLFIDEAYSLASEDHNDSFSKECVDILCEALSDHKDDLMVIVAGYKDEMDKTLFQTNKGLKSRFIWQFETGEYDADALLRIFLKKIKEQGWNADKVSSNLQKWFQQKKDTFKYYGRDIELLITYVKISHGRRVYGQPVEDRKCLIEEDMNKGYACFMRNKSTQAQESVPYGLYV
jgi:hypothetical protein